ncbi:MAG TPA: UvrD-helicase domain-containing protein [Candidatus Limnocylindria bacterium]|nr:UvrD-helicase domain-containing protein [Candidatus Limnocylindria bacterium]
MAWPDGLDGVHREIAESPHPRIGVLAGPGTGKTRYGLLRRVARLLEVDHVAPEQILLLSFTRTAAQDLVNKLAELHSPGAEMVRATTIHAFCFSVLQKDAVLGATGRKPRTLLEHETDFMLRDLEGDFGDIYARRELLHAFEAGWAREQSQHSPDFVRVMSLHKSKGLTSPVVFLATAIDGILPTLDDDDTEEEQELDRQESRRLFYVALTRSGDELVISYPSQMLSKDAFGMATHWGKLWREDGELMASCVPTPYLKELGEKQPAAVPGVEWLGKRG